MSRDYRAYSIEQAASLSGLSERRLRRWAADDMIAPEFSASGEPDFGFYSFRDIVSLRTAATLIEKGAKPRVLKGLNRWFLDHREDYPDPWATLRIEIYGDEPYFYDIKTKRYVGSKPPGQLLLELQLEMKSIAIDVEHDAAHIGERDVADRGQLRPGARGRMFVRGTRVPTSAIASFADAGFKPRDIQHEYPDLTLKDINAALLYERRRAS